VAQQQSLSPDEAERVRAALEELSAEFRTQAELAAALIMPDGKPVSQQIVSSVLNRAGPAGVSLARAVANARGILFDELISGRRLSNGAMAPECYETVPGWKESAAKVIESGYAPRYAVRAAGKMWVNVRPPKVTPEFVHDLAMFWLRHTSIELRIAAERAEVEANVAEDARHKPVSKSGERLREDRAAEQEGEAPARTATPGKSTRRRGGR
jgi:hypothetical protein